MVTVLLIDPDGNNLGQHLLDSAEQIAEERFGLDLLEVRPGVYKIVDLGKLKYEASKRKQPKSKPIKEMKFKLNIGDADFITKCKGINKFLSAGNTVKVTIWFSGREVSRPDAGCSLMQAIIEATEPYGTAIPNWELQGKNMYLTLEPRKK
jgi:translation initiation factor IF-3